MTAVATEIPQRVRESWAAEIAAEARAAEVAQAKAKRDAVLAAEAPAKLAAATSQYLSARAEVEAALDVLDRVFPACAQARLTYESAFAGALKADVLDGVRIAPLARGASVTAILNFAGRS